MVDVSHLCRWHALALIWLRQPPQWVWYSWSKLHRLQLGLVDIVAVDTEMVLELV